MRTRAMTVVVLGVAASLTAAGEPRGEPDKPPESQDQRIARLCRELGETQYGRMDAHEKLVQIGEAAMPALRKALKDWRPQARWWAAAAIAKLATQDGFQAIVHCIRNEPNAFVRSTAVYHLRYFRTRAKIDIWPIAEEALMDKNADVAWWALRLMVEDSAPRVKDGYAKLDETYRKILASGASKLRAYAMEHVRKLRETDPKKATAYLPLIRQLLGAKDARLRADTVWTVFELLDDGHLAFLRGVYEKDDDPIVQDNVLRCVTRMPAPPVESIELFILGMDSKDEKVRNLAGRLIRKGCKRYFGFNARDELDRRRAAIENWTNWYQANRAKLQWEPDLRKFLLPGQRPPKPAKPATRAKPTE